MKQRTHNRIIAFLLALLMAFGDIAMPVYSVESETQPAADDFSQYVGYEAVFNTSEFGYFPYMESKPAGDWEEDAPQLPAEDIPEDLVMEIVDYYVLQATYTSLWYQVNIIGGTAPEGFADGYWVFQDYLGEDSYGVNSLVLTEPPVAEAETLTDATTGVSVTGDLPKGAVLEVIDYTGTYDGVYDIKIYLEDGVTEWQPIDEGKTVTISIPVEGVEDGEYVDVYHYIDHKADIDGDEYIISTEGMEEAALTILQPALAAYDDGVSVATEISKWVAISNGAASVETGSFSVFYYDNASYGDSDGNLGTEDDPTIPNPINFDAYNVDNGKTYFVTRGTKIYCYNANPDDVAITCNKTPAAIEYTESITYGSGWNRRTAYIYTVKSDAPIYSTTTFFKDNSVIEDITIRFVVMPELTVKFESHLTDWQSFVTVPADVTGIFMGNCPADQHDPANGLYGALNYTLPAATIADGVEGYTFKNWYVKHAPAYTFAAGETISLSNETLQVDWDEDTDSYTVILVADFDYVPHKYTYVYGDGETENKTVEYLFEDILTIEDPTWEGYNFLYWEISSSDPVECWTTQFSNGQVPGGSTVTNMYGDVTLTAIWAAAGDTAYTVRHMYESLTNPGTYEFTGETTTQYGTTGEQTDASLAKKTVAGFYVDETDANCYVNVEITGDGTAIAEIRYKRAETTITFVDPFDGNKELGKLTGTYGASVTGVPAPEKTNYVFMGWYTADYPDQNYIVTTYPATDLTLYAKWNLDKVTIDLMDGETLLGRINEYATTQIDKPAFTKAGYILEGWYKDQALTTSVGFDSENKYKITETDDGTTWYAKWTEIKYSVTFDTDEGTLEGETNPTKEYTINTMPTSIPEPTKTGYTFGGWYATEDCTGTPYTTTTLAAALQADDDHAITVYAKWTINKYTVTYVADGNTVYTEEVAYGGDVTSIPEIPTKTGYDQTEPAWDHDGKNITANTIINAVYTANKYTVTWKNPDDTVLKTDTLEYGDTPQWTGENPSYSTTDNGYTWSGWTPEIQSVTGNVEYTATYTEWSTITWENYDGTVLETDQVNTGVLPEYNSSTPQRPADAQYTYTFSGWSPIVDEATKHVTYTAQYSTTVNKYTVTWKNADGTVLETDENVPYGTTPTYDGATPTKAATAQYTYTFAGWNPAISAVTGEAAYTATYTKTVNTYTITWKNADGTVLETDTDVPYGTTPTYDGAEPTKNKTGYTCKFSGWTPAVSPVTADATYTATFSETINQYTITFDTDGGSEVAAITQDYGTAVTAPVDPTKTGYTFAGWDTEIPATMPAGDMTIKAKWTVNQYTITFDTDGGTAIEAITQDYGTAVTAPVAPTKTGYTFAGWDKEIPSTMPAENVTIKAQWTINQYTITFNTDGGSEVAAITQDYNTAVTAPVAPTKTGYTFAGWDKEIPSTMPAEDMTITAQWKVNQYTITFDTDGGSEVAAITQDYGTAVTAPVAPTKTGYTFAGWDKEIPATMPAKDMTIKAKWTVNQYTITWVDGDGKILKTEQVAYGETPAYTGATPTKTATAQYTYAFNNTWSPEIVEVTKDATYTAQFDSTVNKYTVKFVNEDGTELQSSEVAYGEMPIYTGETPTKAATAQDSYTFAGWDPEVVTVTGETTYTATYTQTTNKYTITWIVDGTKTTEEYEYGATPSFKGSTDKAADAQYTYTFKGWDSEVVAVTGDATYTAQYTSTVNKYTVTWIVDGKETTEEYDYGATPVYPNGTPTKAATAQYTYTFKEWSPAIVAVNGDATYTAQFDGTVNEYTITWVDGYGNALKTEKVAYGAAVTAPANPAKTGYTFAGWDKTIPTTMPAENVTITATWTANTYTVEFNSNGGSGSMANQDFTYDAAQSLTANAFTRTGYTFAGWNTVANGSGKSYADKESVKNLIATADGTVTLYAQWTINQYTITFADTGDTVMAPIKQDYGTAVTAPGNPTKTGYTFAGWDKEIPATMPAENVTITAQWTINQYTITFNTDGGSEVAAITQDYGTAVTAPSDPTKTGYTFAGWDKTIPTTMPAENVTITAQWTINQYTITFDTDGGSEIAPIKQDYGTAVTAPADPTKEGYTFAGWDTEIPSTMPAENVTIKAKWTINQYTIIFANTGDTVIAPITQNYGTTVTAPGNPTKTGYTFAGWDVEIPATMPAKDMTIKAKWTINQYTITFDTDGGSEVAAITQDYGTAVIAPADPTKTGYTFAGWSPAIPATMPAENITVKAQWTLTPFNVEFDKGEVESATLPANTTGTMGQEITLQAASADGYAFKGWKCNVADCEDIHTAGGVFKMPAQNVVLTAQWTKTHNLTVSIDNGTVTYNGVDQGSTMSVALKTGTGAGNIVTVKPSTGYKIISITDANGNSLDIPTADGTYTYTIPAGGLTADTTIEVKTQKIEVVVVIVIGTDGNETEIVVQKGSDVLIAITPYDEATKISSIVVYKQFGETTQINQNVADGYIFAVSNITQNMTIEVNATSKNVHFSVGAIGNGTVTLKYGEETVTTGSGTDTEDLVVDTTNKVVPYGESYAITLAPNSNYAITDEKENKNLTPDSNNATSTSWVYTGTMTGDAVIIAETSQLHYITYELNGGTLGEGITNPTSYTVKSAAITLNNPTREGYTFAGWTGTDLDKATADVTIPTGSTGNRAYIATWTINEYTITYDLADGILDAGVTNPDSYTIDSTDVLPTPTKTGCTFKGWKVTVADGSWAADTVWEAGTSLTGKYGDVTLTAQWEQTLTDLVISVEGGKGTTFIFDVTGLGSDGKQTTIRVIVAGGSSVTIKNLLVGESYTITMVSNWNMWYSLNKTSESITLGNSNNKVEFTAEARNFDWLGGEG